MVQKCPGHLAEGKGCILRPAGNTGLIGRSTSYTSLGRLNGVWKNLWPEYIRTSENTVPRIVSKRIMHNPICQFVWPWLFQITYWAERMGLDYKVTPLLQVQSTVSQSSILTVQGAGNLLQIFSFSLWIFYTNKILCDTLYMKVIKIVIKFTSQIKN